MSRLVSVRRVAKAAAFASCVLLRVAVGQQPPHTRPWWTTNLRLGWEGEVASVRLRPFLGFNNLFNRSYVGSVVINGSNRRYYEPAPGRNVFIGFSVGAGE